MTIVWPVIFVCPPLVSDIRMSTTRCCSLYFVFREVNCQVASGIAAQRRSVTTDCCTYVTRIVCIQCQSDSVICVHSAFTLLATGLCVVIALDGGNYYRSQMLGCVHGNRLVCLDVVQFGSSVNGLRNDTREKVALTIVSPACLLRSTHWPVGAVVYSNR